MIYLANAFSPSMLTLPVDVSFAQIDKKEFCEVVTGGVQNAIGHKGTVDLVNALCGTSLSVNRISVRARIGDTIYMLTLALRLEEGKVLTEGEIRKMYEEGKVKFVKATLYGAVLAELSNCEGVCNELDYDALAHKAKGKGDKK